MAFPPVRDRRYGTAGPARRGPRAVGTKISQLGPDGAQYAARGVTVRPTRPARTRSATGHRPGSAYVRAPRPSPGKAGRGGIVCGVNPPGPRRGRSGLRTGDAANIPGGGSPDPYGGAESDPAAGIGAEAGSGRMARVPGAAPSRAAQGPSAGPRERPPRRRPGPAVPTSCAGRLCSIMTGAWQGCYASVGLLWVRQGWVNLS
ncbi:hypothetical protein GCM10010425_20910 [Streptomyces spororaveus]